MVANDRFTPIADIYSTHLERLQPIVCSVGKCTFVNKFVVYLKYKEHLTGSCKRKLKRD